MRFLFTLLFAISTIGAADPLAVYLSWSKDPLHTMTILWINDIEETAIYYQEENSGHWKQAFGKTHALPKEVSPYKLHSVEVENLQAGTKYCFRIGNNTAEYRFRTMPETLSEKVTFVVGGDTCHNGMKLFKKTNIQAAKEEPYFALLGGDLAYAWKKQGTPENGEKWLKWLKAYSKTMVTKKGYLIPLLVTIGNHDVTGGFNQTAEEAFYFNTLFPLPGKQGYGVLRFGNYLSLYLLNTGHTAPIPGAQTHWLAQELAKDSSITHRFACYHVPAYPSIHKFDSKKSKQVREHWVPIFEQYNLHLAFENHDHTYKRTYPLRNGKKSANGIIYVGDGSWGTKPNPPQKIEEKPYLEKLEHKQQFLKVELSQQGCKVQAIKPNGKVIDSFHQK